VSPVGAVSPVAAVARVPRVNPRRPGTLRLFVETGGLIALGGPPLGGKALLCARLVECLPRAVRLEAIDNLSRNAPYWQPAGSRGRTVSNPTAAMLTEATRIWSAQQRKPPVVVLVARFGTATERRRVRSVARRNGMRFLFVEARSRDNQALRRIPSGVLSAAELQERLRRYDAAVQAYRPVERSEALDLAALRLTGVLSRLDQHVDRVLQRWRAT